MTCDQDIQSPGTCWPVCGASFATLPALPMSRWSGFDDISVDFKKMEVQRDWKLVFLTA
jgi:hypothetical protein